MRLPAAALLVVALGVLSGCSLFGRGGSKVPEGDAWREEVVAAIEGTPGVSAADVSVHEVDDGAGSKGPVIYGAVSVTGDTQTVVDDMLRRVSDVLGPDSSGVGLNLSIADESGGKRLRDLGYAGVHDGARLWEATH